MLVGRGLCSRRKPHCGRSRAPALVSPAFLCKIDFHGKGVKSIITDMHTHFVTYDNLKPKLIEDMARCGMDPTVWDITEDDYIHGTSAADKTVVFGMRAKAAGWDVDDERVAAFAAKDGRYIFFASVDPVEKGYMERLRYAHEKQKCSGLKLSAFYQGVHPHDPRYYEIYSYCEKHGLPIISHTAAAYNSGLYLDYARPIHMDKVACDFPGLNIILAHLGHPWIEETIALIRKQPNLYSDISALYYRPWQFYNAMRVLEEYKAQGKVFFGSDFPVCTTKDSINGLKGVNKAVEGTGLPPVSSGVIDEILYSDAVSIIISGS